MLPVYRVPDHVDPHGHLRPRWTVQRLNVAEVEVPMEDLLVGAPLAIVQKAAPKLLLLLS